jgi:hypothetical protein
MPTYQTACKRGQPVVCADADQFGPAPIRSGVDREYAEIVLTDAGHVEAGVLTAGQARQLAADLVSAADELDTLSA